MYLLDTPVIAELRRARSGRADPGVVTWAGGVPAQNLFISALSLLELETGVAQAERRNRVQGAGLRRWLDDQVMAAFDGRILAVDAAVVKKRGSLSFSGSGAERDAVFAATALVHGLTIVTRSPISYRTARVKLFNPWGYTPEEPAEELDWQKTPEAGAGWLKNLFVRF